MTSNALDEQSARTGAPRLPARWPPAVLRALAALCVAGAFALLFVGRTDSSTAQVTSRTFTYFDGSTGSFADYRGQPLVVNFWASTCAPCVKEMPEFEAVHQEVGDRVAFLGVDVQERVEEGLPMARSTGVTYDLASDFDGLLIFETAPIVLLPTTAFVDAGGDLVATHTGALTEDQLRARLQELFDL